MKTMKNLKLFCLIITLVFFSGLKAQNPENWTKDQLMQPAELAQLLKSGKDLPIIFSVGPGALIPNSKNMGMAKDSINIAKLKKELAVLPKDARIVLYCGCCPFEHCPNVRPAISALKELNFTNYQLLNLSNNLKVDWIDKGYPVNKN